MRTFEERLQFLVGVGQADFGSVVWWRNWFLVDRDARFAPGNDKVWGKGQWVRCDTCVDSLGYPAYHHKNHHPFNPVEFRAKLAGMISGKWPWSGLLIEPKPRTEFDIYQEGQP